MNESMISDKLTHSMDYATYRSMVDELLQKDQTTGLNHSETMLGYTRMNVVRMNRLDKTLSLTAPVQRTLSDIKKDYIWLVITEAWCGDAAYTVPLLAKMAESTERITLRVILRDEHPELIDAYLTDGARSIPKLLIIDAATHQVLTNWGPRPAPAQEMLYAWKAEVTPRPYSEFSKDLQRWYARDKSITTQLELLPLLRQLNTEVLSIS